MNHGRKISGGLGIPNHSGSHARVPSGEKKKSPLQVDSFGLSGAAKARQARHPPQLSAHPPNPINSIHSHPLVRKLSKSNSLDQDFLKTLEKIKAEIKTSNSQEFLVTIGKLLVQKISRIGAVVVKEKSPSVEKRNQMNSSEGRIGFKKL